MISPALVGSLCIYNWTIKYQWVRPHPEVWYRFCIYYLLIDMMRKLRCAVTIFWSEKPEGVDFMISKHFKYCIFLLSTFFVQKYWFRVDWDCLTMPLNEFWNWPILLRRDGKFEFGKKNVKKYLKANLFLYEVSTQEALQYPTQISRVLGFG